MANTPLPTVGSTSGFLWTQVRGNTGVPTSVTAQAQRSTIVCGGSPTGGVAAVAQIVTSSFAGVPSAGTPDVNTITVGGFTSTLDVLQVGLDGEQYGVLFSEATSNDDVAAALSNAVNNGASDTVTITYTGMPAVDDVAAVFIDGTEYDYTCADPTDGPEQVVAALVTAISGGMMPDPNYLATQVGGVLILTAIVPESVGTKTITNTTATGLNLFASQLHLVHGTDANTAYDVSVSGSVLLVTCLTLGADVSSIQTRHRRSGGNPLLSVNRVTTGTFADTLGIVLGMSSYSHTVTAGQTLVQAITSLVTATAGNVVWTAVRSGTTIVSTAATAGVTSSPVQSLTSGGLTHSDAITTPGVNAVAASHYKVTDGTHTYDYTCVGVDRAVAATGLAALINVDYTATASSSTITITGAAGVSFAFVDQSTLGASVVFAVVTPATTTEVDVKTGRTGGAATCAVYFNLISGTSFVLVPWLWNNATNTFSAGTATAALAANSTVIVDTRGADGLYVELKSQVGSAVATVYACKV